jgi:predicted dehydrogenase
VTLTRLSKPRTSGLEITLKVAIIEASHWHVPLYLDALSRDEVEVVAVSDREDARGHEIARRFGCKLYTSYEDLLSRESFDVAFAFGRHSDMPRIGEALIKRGIPMAMEKPCGRKAADAARLRDLAAQQGLYVAVPLIFRLSDLLRELKAFDNSAPSSFNHIAFRFIAGSLSRYERAGSPWMLDPDAAGGGCTMNLAVHFIDLFRVLTGQAITSVSALMNHKSARRDVEDYSVLTLTTEDGTIGVIETGYTFPGDAHEQREYSFTLSSEHYYLRSGDESIHIRNRSTLGEGTKTVAVRLNSDDYYPVFVERVLRDIQSGAAPIAGLADIEAVMRVIDAGYASARAGGAPVRLEKSGTTEAR